MGGHCLPVSVGYAHIKGTPSGDCAVNLPLPSDAIGVYLLHALLAADLPNPDHSAQGLNPRSCNASTQPRIQSF